VRVGVVSSGLSEAQARIAGFTAFSGPGEAVRWARDCLGEGAKAAVLVEDAGNMTLRL
jgi:hypothetical protein